MVAAEGATAVTSLDGSADAGGDVIIEVAAVSAAVTDEGTVAG